MRSGPEHRQQSKENHPRGKGERKPSLEGPTLQCPLGTAFSIRYVGAPEFEKTLHRCVAARRAILETRSAVVAGSIMLTVGDADLAASHADRRQHPGSCERLVRLFSLTCHSFNGAMDLMRGKPATAKNHLIQGLRTSNSRLVRVPGLITHRADSDAFGVLVIGFEPLFRTFVRSNGGTADGTRLPDHRR